MTGDPEPGKEHGGLISLSMRQAKRPDHYAGFIHTVIEPSARLPNTGIYMSVNDHYDFTSADLQDSSLLVEVLENRWTASLEYAEFIINQIMELAIKVRNNAGRS